ncbi:hypothetical protein BDV33DRAFT_163253 [Aspergillus novoparasiticus]|uniref:Uncharacterized protein n=1 Tax=Aspergillus novoparasiticus TaxID=986946 RepID=A0A5N6FAH3_9EURO|nr:hypothetical protein BDV33DRAFT_163253 [Aspergillus novoparasiticus]
MEQALTNGQLPYVGSKKFAEKPVWETATSSKTKSPISPLPTPRNGNPGGYWSTVPSRCGTV